jgi:hypothetical protein
MSIITGEKIQQSCDVYIGSQQDFNFNPVIAVDKHKHVLIHTLTEPFQNPYRIFCYSHNIALFSQKIHLLQNNFILFTHNSDGEIRQTPEVLSILNCPNLIKWFGQNSCFQHPKLFFLPIGLANSQWPHGNLSFFNSNFMTTITKSNTVFFNFNIHTNVSKRQRCYDSLTKLEWLPMINPTDNLKRLSTYKFCICPEGNGVDTHRLWECLYLKVVPIVIKSNFTDILLSNHIPLVVLNEWSDLNLDELNYDHHNFDAITNLLDINYFKN